MKGWMRVMTIGLTAVVAVTVGLPLLPVFMPRAALACVVGTGTSATCTEAALNACLPGTVTFNCGGSATITVTATKTISANTSIDGGGLITISGGNSKRVFSVSNGVDFSVQNLTIANGFSASGAGAIDTGNTGGGTLTVTNSTFSGNASCISGQYKTMIITNSTFSGNSASGGGNGGALKVGNGTIMSVTSSTFSGNSAGSSGGVISNNGSGTVTITNSTFSGNSAVSSGGVIANAGGVTVTNSILANSSPAGSNCSGAHAPLDGGNNIDDGATCGFTGTNCTTTTGSSFCNTNPVLDPTGLQNNGGPTQTIALEAGSPAINAGNESVCAASPVNSLDQRGFGRPGTGHTNCSIGAYEADAAIPALSGWGVVTFSGLALIFILWQARRHPRRFAAA